MGLLHSFKATFSFPFFCCKGNHSISDLSSVLTLCFPPPFASCGTNRQRFWKKEKVEKSSSRHEWTFLKEVPEELISRQLFQCGKPSVSEHRKKGTQFKTQNCAKGVSRLFPKYISFEATCLNRRRLLLASLKQNNCETIAFSFPLHPHYYRVASAEEYSKRTTSDATFLSQTHFSS